MIFSTLRVVLDHAVYQGALAINPVKQIRTKDRPKASESRRRVLPPEEEMRLLAYCEPFTWLRPIITVALYQALRLGEVLGLQWEDVDFTSRKLTVRHSLAPDKTLGPTKGGKPRTIMLTEPARQVLLELRQDSDGTGYVFRNAAGLVRDRNHLRRNFNAAVERAALPDTDDGPVVFHSLRHIGISRLANSPLIPLVKVRDFAGHSKLETTDPTGIPETREWARARQSRGMELCDFKVFGRAR
jgi:integrase